MDAGRFIKNLERDGISIWPEGDSLRYRAPEGTLSPLVLAELKTHKQAILAYFTQTLAWWEKKLSLCSTISELRELAEMFEKASEWEKGMGSEFGRLANKRQRDLEARKL